LQFIDLQVISQWINQDLSNCFVNQLPDYLLNLRDFYVLSGLLRKK